MKTLKWCGPIAIQKLTGRCVRDREMRTVDVVCYLDKYLGIGNVKVRDIMGKKLVELPKFTKALLVFPGHVVPMMDGQVSNLNGFGDTPVVFVVQY